MEIGGCFFKQFQGTKSCCMNEGCRYLWRWFMHAESMGMSTWGIAIDGSLHPSLIGAIVLWWGPRFYSFGYLEARDKARKLVAAYRLCSEQLSSQVWFNLLEQWMALPNTFCVF
jgi:hypothetical protein